MVTRKLLGSFDWQMLAALLAIAVLGVVEIHSSTLLTPYAKLSSKQVLWILMGLAALLTLLLIDYHTLGRYVHVFYVLCVAVLIAVLAYGKVVHGSRSWFGWGSVGLQPSEFAKVVTVLALAKLYSEVTSTHLRMTEVGTGMAVLLIPMGLVVLQGDLGTAITFLPIFLALAFVGGVRKKLAVIMVIAAVLAAPLGWMVLKDYQKERIKTVFNPSADPKGKGYQSIQSMIAIGSGGFLGKGILRGSQSQLRFLPEPHNDFIFATLAEELGFLGAVSCLGLYLFVLLRCLKIAREAKDRLGSLIVVGVTSVLLFHVLVNMGMVMGLVPIVGIPLPLMSYGGSSVVSTFVAIGLVLNIGMRRFVNY
ncbi:MAG: rod shape-determining protein RodA [Acidobacteria bacterium]|nr:rod shape-determining protein RodA [Acidobacteriota bacterium]